MSAAGLIRRSGFTMVEIVIAMAIFAIGFVAVAAIFPVATLLQKQTVEDVIAQKAANNARSVAAVLMPARDAGGLVSPNIDTILRYDVPAQKAIWDDQKLRPLWEGSGNNDILGPTGVANAVLTLGNRTYRAGAPTDYNATYWVPLAKRVNAVGSEGWRVTVFVLTKRQGETWNKSSTPNNWANKSDPNDVPGVYKAGLAAGTGDNNFVLSNPALLSDFRIGDKVVDDNGYEYTIMGITAPHTLMVNNLIVPNPDNGANATALWYGKPSAPGKASPLRRVVHIDIADPPSGGGGGGPPPSTFMNLIMTLDNVSGGGTQATIIVDDNGTAGGSFTITAGTWTYVGTPSPAGYLTDITHNGAAGGTGTKKVRWTFTGLGSDTSTYRVWATWNWHTNRATNAPYTVYDGTTALGTVTHNQEIQPSINLGDSVNWEVVGEYSITGGNDLVVELTDNANEYVVADAIRIQRISTP